MDKWSGNHRNDLLYNVGVLEMKKADGKIKCKRDEKYITKKKSRNICNTNGS